MANGLATGPSLVHATNAIIRRASTLIRREDWVDTRYDDRTPRWIALVPVIQLGVGISLALETLTDSNAIYHLRLADQHGASFRKIWTWQCEATVPQDPTATSIGPAIATNVLGGTGVPLSLLVSFLWSRYVKRRGLQLRVKNMRWDARAVLLCKRLLVSALIMVGLAGLIAVASSGFASVYEIPKKTCPEVFWLLPLSRLVLAAGLSLFGYAGAYVWRTQRPVPPLTPDNHVSRSLYPSKPARAAASLLVVGLYSALLPLDWLPSSMQTPSHVLYHRISAFSAPVVGGAIYYAVARVVTRLSFHDIPLLRKLVLPKAEFEERLVRNVADLVRRELQHFGGEGPKAAREMVLLVQTRANAPFDLMNVGTAALVGVAVAVLGNWIGWDKSQLAVLEGLVIALWALSLRKRHRVLEVIATGLQEYSYSIGAREA